MYCVAMKVKYFNHYLPLFVFCCCNVFVDKTRLILSDAVPVLLCRCVDPDSDLKKNLDTDTDSTVKKDRNWN